MAKKKMNPLVSLEVPCLITLSQGNVFNLIDALYIFYDFWFCVFMGFLCISASMYISCVFFFDFFLIYLFLFYFIFSLDACLFSNHRQKWGVCVWESRWEGRCGGAGKSNGRET